MRPATEPTSSHMHANATNMNTGKAVDVSASTRARVSAGSVAAATDLAIGDLGLHRFARRIARCRIVDLPDLAAAEDDGGGPRVLGQHAFAHGADEGEQADDRQQEGAKQAEQGAVHQKSPTATARQPSPGRPHATWDVRPICAPTAHMESTSAARIGRSATGWPLQCLRLGSCAAAGDASRRSAGSAGPLHQKPRTFHQTLPTTAKISSSPRTSRNRRATRFPS